MSKKRDWVKIIAICLAIVFFILWILTRSNNTQIGTTCEQKITQYEQGNNLTLTLCEQKITEYQQALNQTLSLCEIGKNQTVINCNQAYKTLFYQWQSSFNTVLNCYENNVPNCKYSIPTLNET